MISILYYTPGANNRNPQMKQKICGTYKKTESILDFNMYGFDLTNTLFIIKLF